MRISSNTIRPIVPAARPTTVKAAKHEEAPKAQPTAELPGACSFDAAGWQTILNIGAIVVVVAGANRRYRRDER